MSSGREDQGRGPRPVDERPLQFLRLTATAALTLLVLAVLGLALGPKDAGTLTLYGLVIGFNLLIALLYWPAVRFLRRMNR